MTRHVLPRSLEGLAGLRAARYRRESTEEQGTKYGPEEQDAEIERFMARYDLVDTGIVFTDHHSGWQRSEARPEFTAMMASAAEGAFDVLVVAYFSRFSRNIRQALEAHDILHRGGVAIAFADERFVSSDEDAWEDFVDEAVSAEKYSRKLSRRIKNTLRAKFERHGDQAGTRGPRLHPHPAARGPAGHRPRHDAAGGAPLRGVRRRRRLVPPARRAPRHGRGPRPGHPLQPPLQRLVGAPSPQRRRGPARGALAR